MATDSEILSQEEVESELRQEQPDDPKDEDPKSADQQPLINSLTVDEFQNTVHEGNKNFGSMNLDEFLNSIWMAEENQAHKTAAADDATSAPDNICNTVPFPPHDGNSTQPSSVIRQDSLTVPARWCQKTVDEVWSEIIKTEQQQQQSSPNNLQIPNYPERQCTLGEMTLEEFLIKTGVIKEQSNLSVPQQPPPSTYMSYLNTSNPVVGSSYTTRSFLSVGIGGGISVPTELAQSGIVGEAQPYIGNGDYVPVETNLSHVDKSNQYGVNGSGIMSELVVQKVVERRQRRMIKNRESAARARARKQAYTAELETELSHLKEENETLKQALAEHERKLKQQSYTGAENVKDKFRMLRRNLSCPY